MQLSVIIPVYNEEQTIYEIIDKVNKQKKTIDLEIIVIDDYSTDASRKILTELKDKKKNRLFNFSR